MGWVSVPLLWLSALVAADDGPKKPPAPPIPMPPVEFQLAPQPVYGVLRPIRPAHGLALIETRQPMPDTDPVVAQFSLLLGQSTARYVEDAGRIAEVTASLCKEIRDQKKESFPSEILEGALVWNRPPGSRPDVPRKFSQYARQYRQLRLKDGKDHKAALALLKTPPAPPVPKQP